MNLRPLKQASLFLLMPVAALAVMAVSYFRAFDNYELGSLDLRFILRGPIPATDKIAIIEIGEDTIAKLGRFPFDRSYHAILVKALHEAGSRMILLDLLFSEPQEHDPELVYAMNQAASVCLPYAFDINSKGSRIISVRGYLAKCIETLAKEAAGTGHINVIPDPDGKFRRIPLLIKYGDSPHPYISFLMGLDYLGIPISEARLSPGRYINYGPGRKIPLDENSNMIVNFTGKWGTVYKHYSYIDILQSYLASTSGEKPPVNLAELKDKICIVGLTATGTGDAHPNPFEPIYPGMGMHAEVINSMLSGKFITRPSRIANLLVLVILSLLTSFIIFKTKPVRGLLVLLAGAFLFTGLAIELFNYFGLWIDLVYPLVVMVLAYISLTLYKYLNEWKTRLILENELGIARKIQESFLPKKAPEAEGVDIASSMMTARQVGGDLYDFVDFERTRFGVMIGDVSGKGVPASLFMAMVIGAFRSFANIKTFPKELLAKLNSKLIQESSSNLFVTVFYAVFDLKNMTCVFSNGGHLPVAKMSAAGDVKYLDVESGTPLGLMENDYAESMIEIKKGDTFVFYTDGITEAMNPKRELYGAERLESVIRNHKDKPADSILKAIEKDVRIFEPKDNQHDDMTVIVVKV